MDFNAMFSDATAGFHFGDLLNLGSILRILATIVVGLILIKIVMGIVDRTMAKSGANNALGKYLRSVIKVVLWILLALVVAEGVGINTTSLIALFSVAGLAVSLALQNTLANLAGGVMLLVAKPFEVGDFVETNGVSGSVEAISLAYTKLATGDNKSVFIPNAEISSAKSINYTRLGTRRVDLTFTASYDAPTATVRKAINETLAQFPQIMADPAPVIFLSNYGASSIEYVVRAWTSSADYWDVYFGVMEGVRESFARNGVEMTYDHLNVHVVEK